MIITVSAMYHPALFWGSEGRLSAPDPSDGFTALWENGRLDLTVENRALKP